jgi:predicted RNA-binding protein YlxR (DUF448 family)
MTTSPTSGFSQPSPPSPDGAAGRGRARGEDDRRAPERTCVATREVRPSDQLIRFVRAPDGTVVPDLKRELPGRGVWVTASREAVRLAVRRKAFARGFREAATVDPAIDETVGALIEKSALGLLGFANKAGLVVAGFAKVEAALAKERVTALVEASDGSDDGVRKIGQALRRFGLVSEVRIMRLFEGRQLDLALGRSNVVHAALLAGPVSAAFLARCDAFARYLGMDGPGAGDPGMSDGSGPAESARSSSIGSGGTPERTDRA